MSGDEVTKFNADAITASEASEIIEMRAAVDVSAQCAEVAHDFFLVRFLRGCVKRCRSLSVPTWLCAFPARVRFVDLYMNRANRFKKIKDSS